MALQSLYIKDELLAKLKKEDNMSRLINNLLEEYYNSTTPPEVRLDELLTMAEQDEKRINELKQQLVKKEQVLNERSKAEEIEWNKEQELSKKKREIAKDYDKYLADNKLDFRKFSFQAYIDKFKLNEFFE